MPFPNSFVGFWRQATENIPDLQHAKTNDKAVSAFLSRFKEVFPKRANKRGVKANNPLRRKGKWWPELPEHLRAPSPPARPGRPGEMGQLPDNIFSQEETSYIKAILPLKSIEEVQNYFRMDRFCELARKILTAKCHLDLRVVEEYFPLMFSENLQAKLHWPSTR